MESFHIISVCIVFRHTVSESCIFTESNENDAYENQSHREESEVLFLVLGELKDWQNYTNTFESKDSVADR